MSDDQNTAINYPTRPGEDMNEKDIQRQIVDYLRKTGWFVAITSQKGFSFATPGLPDLICVKFCIEQLECTNAHIPYPVDYKTSRTLWLEVKGPRGKQRLEQKNFQDGLEAQGGEYLLANSLDVVMEHLK